MTAANAPPLPAARQVLAPEADDGVTCTAAAAGCVPASPATFYIKRSARPAQRIAIGTAWSCLHSMSIALSSIRSVLLMVRHHLRKGEPTLPLDGHHTTTVDAPLIHHQRPSSSTISAPLPVLRQHVTTSPRRFSVSPPRLSPPLLASSPPRLPPSPRLSSLLASPPLLASSLLASPRLLPTSPPCLPSPPLLLASPPLLHPPHFLPPRLSSPPPSSLPPSSAAASRLATPHPRRRPRLPPRCARLPSPPPSP